MILKGNQREMAKHLLNSAQNEHVKVHAGRFLRPTPHRMSARKNMMPPPGQ